MTTAAELKRKLLKHLKMDLELVLNENRSTMLSVLERRRRFARVSIHKMFLQAPEEVLASVASFVKGKQKRGDLQIRGFIQTHLKQFDYSKNIDTSKHFTVGLYYDLGEIYDSLNQEYFDNTFRSTITWYGTRARKSRVKVTFGQYHDHLKLVKIHRILDDPFFPLYFVRFIVYHEMLHGIIPGYVDERGYFRIHGPAFKKREQEFVDYERAVAWEKKNKKRFFVR